MIKLTITTSKANAYVNATEWVAFTNNTLVTVTFYANDTEGNLASNYTQVYLRLPLPSIVINSPSNSTVFNATAWKFYITYIGGGPVHTMWYTMNEGVTNHTFTENTTIDPIEWSSFASNTLVTVIFCK